MNGNDLLSHPMMLAHQRRLLAEARELHLAEATRIAAKAAATDAAKSAAAAAASAAGRSSGRRPVGAPPSRGGRRSAAAGPAGGGSGARRRPGLAGRLGATLVALDTRLEALERSRHTG